MRRRRYFAGLAALLVAASMLLIAAPAGAAGFGSPSTLTGTDTCVNSMNPANSGNSSGLYIACTFASGLTSAGSALTILDYKNAVWHSAATRQVTVKVSRSSASGEAGNYVLRWEGANAIATQQLGPQASDVNHSIENPTSTQYFVNGNNNAGTENTPLASFIDAGTTIRAIGSDGGGSFWVLSKPTIAGKDDKPTCPVPTDVSCALSTEITVRIANHVGRDGNNGATTAGSSTVTSAQVNPSGCSTGATPGCTSAGTGNTAAATGMHFCEPALGAECASTDDRGNFLSGGDLPDGAQISTVPDRNTVTLLCQSTPSVGGAPVWNWGGPATTCGGGFGLVTALADLQLTITPYPIPTGPRMINCATMTGSKGGVPERTITTTCGAAFSRFDVGLVVRGCSTVVFGAGTICNPATSVANGVRIASVGNGGTTAVMDPASGTATTWTTGTNQHVTIGFEAKTAPATGGIIGSLAIALIVSPDISPTSPPCAANKVSGFQLPLHWRTPGFAPSLTVPSANGGYDFGFAGPPVNQFAGSVMTGISRAQIEVATSVTTFAGFLKQDLTVGTGPAPQAYPATPTTTRWRIHFENLPVGIGLCSGTGLSETLEVKALENRHAMNPSGTGGGFGAVRALLPELQNTDATNSTYTGTGTGNLAGANVTTTGSGPTSVTNTCKVTSPNIIGIGCQ